MLNKVITIPTYEKSKKLNPEEEIVALYSEIIIFGGVPIAVFIPPKIQANAKGIKNIEACHSIFWHIFRVIGNKIANAPILFINEERIAAINKRQTKNWNSVNVLVPINFPTKPVRPEFFKPWLIINTSATVTTAGCANPANASLAGIISSTTSTNKAPIANASYLTLPQMNKPNRAISVADNKTWSFIGH